MDMTRDKIEEERNEGKKGKREKIIKRRRRVRSITKRRKNGKPNNSWKET